MPLTAVVVLAVAIGVVRSSRKATPGHVEDSTVQHSPLRPVHPPPAPVPARPDVERRERLRERLRRELGDEYDRPLPAATEHDRGRGAYLWARLCAGCHGGDARGRRPLSRMLPVPAGDLTTPERAVFYSDRARLWILSEGSEDTPMFGWKEVLSEPDQFAVLAHLRVLTGDG